MKVLKRTGNLCLAVLACLSAPLLVWAAIIVALRQILAEWRCTRVQLLSGNLVCNSNINCPPGYECVGGRCLPKQAC